MKISMKQIGLGAALLLLVGAAVQPVQAACPFPGVLATTASETEASQISTDSFFAVSSPSPYGYPGQFYVYNQPPLDFGSLTGVWWGLGTGNPTVGAGDDNGSFDVGRWIEYYSGSGPGGTFYYGATFATGWGANAEVDGCIGNTESGCTCILLTQQAPGDVAKFALLSAKNDPDAFFAQSGNAPIQLVPIPKPTIVASVRDQVTFDLTVTTSLPAVGAGVYPLDGCDCALSYRVREIVQTRGLPPPDSRAIADWDGAGNPVDAADAASTIFSACGSVDTDVYLATELAPDPASGFTSPFVSELATRIECGPVLADPVQDKRRRLKATNPERGSRSGR